MVTKILFTVVVACAVLLFFRYRQQKQQDIVTAREKVINPELDDSRPLVGWVASTIVVVMILVSGAMFYSHWLDANEVIYVKVVDSSSGTFTRYEAYRGDIEDRSFRTMDGRTITLALTERMETALTPPARN